ncbi:MAG: nickel insertion protein, partial [Bryobacteraceae bacterium]
MFRQGLWAKAGLRFRLNFGGNPMKICYFDAFSGISGDMSVGALVDAGADWAAVERSLHSLGLDASFRLD